MIISHRHKFIFIKTKKTAGTSMEIALSKFCGPDDVITPITHDVDEGLRQELGYRGAQNYRIPLSKYRANELYSLIRFRKVLEFHAHVGASFIRRMVGSEIWNTYYKFAFERNPFDKVISLYYYRVGVNGESKSVSEAIANGSFNHIPGFNLYTMNSEIAVDRVFKFEELAQATEELTDILKLPEPLELPFTKHKFRAEKSHYRDLLSEEDRQKIERVYAREFAYFGYTW